jgi:hypothetical protein
VDVDVWVGEDVPVGVSEGVEDKVEDGVWVTVAVGMLQVVW